jgi:guanylate kinase
MSEKTEKVVLLGKSGSGKDYLMRKLVEKDMIGCVKMTSRPARKYEIQGVTYDFVTNSIFEEKIQNGEFLCYQRFEVTPEGRDPENWYYGITKEEFERAQVFIMTPEELRSIDIDTELRKKCFVVYIDIDRSVRESRVIKRKDQNDSVKRRMDADDIDFADFHKNGDYDLRIGDPEFNADDIYDLMF